MLSDEFSEHPERAADIAIFSNHSHGVAIPDPAAPINCMRLAGKELRRRSRCDHRRRHAGCPAPPCWFARAFIK
jgi:hypothetical protein